MKLIKKYAKPLAFLVVLSIACLVVQALADLSLPNYMSDIVNVGIQLSGVDDETPKIISEDGYKLVTLFMDDEDAQSFSNGYKLEKAGSNNLSDYEKDFPSVKTKNTYVFNSQSDEKNETVYTAYSNAVMSMISYMKTMADKSGKSFDSSGVSDADITAIYKMLPMLEAAKKQDASQFTLKNSSVSSMSSIGSTFTKMFYSELGCDMNAYRKAYVKKVGLEMLGIAILQTVASIAVAFLSSRVAATMSKNIRRDVFKKVCSFSNAEYNNFSTASLITRSTNDVQQVQMLVVMGLRMMCFAPVMGIGGIVMALNKSVSLSWIIGVAVIVLLGLIMVVYALAMPKFKILQKLIDRLNLVSRENLTGMMVIRAFGNEKYEEKRFDKANDDYASTNLFVQRTMACMMPAMSLLMNVMCVGVIWFGGKAIEQSTLQIGDMMAYLQYAMHVVMSFLFIAMMFVMVPRAMVSANRIQEVLDTENVILDPENPKHIENAKGEIVFNDVSFKYKNASENVISNVSFTAKPGQTTAFIGSTGSGKSTLINLIPRFYDVSEGSITIDDVDIRDISQHELREIIGYVPQKGILFSGDIDSNVRYGKQDASGQQVMKAIEIAQAKDFVEEKDEKLNSPVAQGGTNVSGGQKQRLSIARAIAKNPLIYIFDDSFSALDFKTDAVLRNALKEHTGNSTVLIVAQRVSTIMNADQIIVLDKSRVVGIGTHKQLLKTCNEYREIAESQLAKEELE